MVTTYEKDVDFFFFNILDAQKTFESGVSERQKKQNGVFLTNGLDTIDKILSLIDYTTIEGKKILEPACGQGIFILRIICKVYEINPNKAFINNFIAKSLIFNDIDASMVANTVDNIKALYHFLFDDEYVGTFQSSVSDFTLRNNETAKTLFSTSNKGNALSEHYGKIDYVVGNPPYISLYGRRDKKENEQQRIDYLQNYNQFPAHVQNGKINLVMLFIEHSLCFLKQNGKMSFIIDLAFFETAYQYTRQFLLQNTRIETLITNIKDFEVVSGQIILQVAKTNDNADNIVCIRDEKTKQAYYIPQNKWKTPKDEYKFRFNGCDTSQKIIDTIHAKNDKTILDLYPNKNLRTCTMLLDMEDKFTQSIKKNISDNTLLYYPYYQGSKSLSGKYEAFKHEKHFIYDKALQDTINDALKIELEKQGIKNKKRIGLGETVIYDNAKVFIRQSAKELIANIDFGGSAANNSLYVFSLRNNSTHSLFILKFLCAWLNSDLMTFYAQQQNIIRFAQGKQPQIKISDLGTLPFPTNFHFQETIVNFVEKIFDRENSIEIHKIGINNLVYKYYELSEEQILYIQKSIKDF